MSATLVRHVSEVVEEVRWHGLRSSQARYQHACPIEDVRPVASTNLHVSPPTDPLEWTRFTMRGLGMPISDLTDMLVPGYCSDSVQLFAACDDAQMVAGASLFIWEDVAVLDSGTTLPSHRNRGAQSALIAARVAAAADAGCRWVVAQTAKPVPGESNPSTNTMIRAGLPLLYARPIWTWVSVCHGAGFHVVRGSEMCLRRRGLLAGLVQLRSTAAGRRARSTAGTVRREWAAAG